MKKDEMQIQLVSTGAAQAPTFHFQFDCCGRCVCRKIFWWRLDDSTSSGESPDHEKVSSNSGPPEPDRKVTRHTYLLLWESFVLFPVLFSLPFIFFGWRETILLWYVPLLAIIANIFPSGGAPIAGGIVFIPALIMTGVNAKAAVAFSCATQMIGCGVFTPLQWALLDKKSIITEIIAVCVIAGVAGCLLALVVFPLNPDTVEMFFAGFCVLLAIYVVYGLFHDLTTNDGAVEMNYKNVAIYATSSFVGGMVTAWIGIGIEKVLFILLTSYPHKAHIRHSCVTSIGVVGWVSFFAFWFHLFYLNDVPLKIWCCGLPGLVIGSHMGPQINLLIGSKLVMYAFVLMLLFNSFWIFRKNLVQL